MEPFRVFVSSIMRREVDDLKEERIAAEAVIRHFDPITEPWMFEVEPASSEPLVESYLNAVKQCDVFVLIMGGEATEPIINEFRTAQDHAKPILILAESNRLGPKMQQPSSGPLTRNTRNTRASRISGASCAKHSGCRFSACFEDTHLRLSELGTLWLR